MDLYEITQLLKSSEEELLLSDTQVEIPGPLAELEKKIENLQQENLSLTIAKSIASKEASKLINDELYHALITLNQENQFLRNRYKTLMKDRQLKKQNYYEGPQKEDSLKNSGIFSIASSRKLLQVATPRHDCQKRKIVSPEFQRKSFCPTRKHLVPSRLSLQSKQKINYEGACLKSDNMFLNLFSLIVEQEKQTQKEILKDLEKHKLNQSVVHGDTAHLLDIEKHLEQTYIKIDKMMQLMKIYQDKLDKSTKQCDQLQIVITQFSDAKKRLSCIFQKIGNIEKMSVQIQETEKCMSRINVKQCKSSSLENLDLLLKLLDCKQGSELQRVRMLGKCSSKLIVDSRQSKIRELMQSIRTGRAKFKQIYQIYICRIRALQLKLSKT